MLDTAFDGKTFAGKIADAAKPGRSLLVGLAAIVLGGVNAFAAGKVNVKITSHASDVGHGYYVEYTINGNSYRSDIVGQRINAIAWENMSDDDKKTTVRALGYYRNRVDQFGTATAIEMGDWYNKEWKEAAEILKDRLMAAKYEDLDKIFAYGSDYYAKNFAPTKCGAYEFGVYPKLGQYNKVLEYYYYRAQEAFEVMRQAEYKRTQVAMQSASGDLISLICDKVLVPNITPSGALAGAASIGQKIFSEVLEYADKSAGIGDEIIAKVVGRRVTADVAKEVMTSMGNIVDCQKKIIDACFDMCRELRQKIDDTYDDLVKEKEDFDRAMGDLYWAARAEIEDLVWTNELDSVIVAEDNRLKGVIAEKGAAYSAAQKALDEHWSSENLSKRDAAKTAYEAAQGARDRYWSNIYEAQAQNRAAFIEKYTAEIDRLVAAMPKRPEEAFYWASNSCYPHLRNLGDYNADLDEIAQMSGEMDRYIAADDAFATDMEKWYADAKTVYLAMNDACRSYSAGGMLDRDLVQCWDLADSLHEKCLGDYPGTERKYAEWNAKEGREELKYYTDCWSAFHNIAKPAIDKRAKELEDNKNAMRLTVIGAYNSAYDKLDASLDPMPSYVKSQTLCVSGLVVTEDSELSKRFLADGATGTVNDALDVRDELSSCASAYRSAKFEVVEAEDQLAVYEAVYGKIEAATNNSSGGVLAMDNHSQYAANALPDEEPVFVRREISSENEKYVGVMLALERDFNNYTYAHGLMLEQLDDLSRNCELYSTNVLEETEDPYVRRAYAARCVSKTPKTGYYTTPWSVIMPGYYVGYGKTPYEIAMCEASDRNRGTCSYSYHIPGYAAAIGNIVEDPYDTCIAPLLDEIDAARAAAIGESYDPVDPYPIDPDPVDPLVNEEGEVSPSSPQYVEPDLFEEEERSAFAGNVTYNGWVRNEDGTIAGVLTLKAAKPGKKDGVSKLSGSYTPFGGKKRTLKFANGAMPAVSDDNPNPEVDVPGLGKVRLGGDSLVGVGIDFQAAADLSKDKQMKSGYLAKLSGKIGTWTFAFNTSAGYAAFSVTVDKKGKGKLAGTLPDGTKVSLSSQGALGDGMLAIPFAYAKKGSLGFVFWVLGDGTAALSDVTPVKLAKGSQLKVDSWTVPSRQFALAGGQHMFKCGDIEQEFTVDGKKWTFPKQQKKLKENDPNPYGTKLSFTPKTGVVKGSFSVAPSAGGKAVKHTVNGVVVGSKFCGSAWAKGGTPMKAIAE